MVLSQASLPITYFTSFQNVPWDFYILILKALTGKRSMFGRLPRERSKRPGSAKLIPDKMTALTSIDAVRRKILSLQQAADDAEDRAELLQMEADMERQGRKGVK